MSDSLKSIAVPVNARGRKSRAIKAPAASGTSAGEVAISLQRAQPGVTAAHTYRVGQRLVYRTLMGNSTCTVLRLLPVEKGVLCYRVRSDIESYERNVEESALSLPR
ncbi:MAG: hypothetical protein ACO1OK_10080 [Devosia sp.]